MTENDEPYPDTFVICTEKAIEFMTGYLVAGDEEKTIPEFLHEWSTTHKQEETVLLVVGLADLCITTGSLAGNALGMNLTELLTEIALNTQLNSGR